MKTKKQAAFNVSRTLLLTATICSTYMANASIMDQFTDPQDGRIDASQFILDNSTGFLPIPMMITDPAVGVGGGGALLFFHESEERKQKREAGEEVADTPSSVSGLVGLATDNGTKLYGGFHSGNWLNDRVRYLGGLFKADVNLNYNFMDDVKVQVNSDAVYFFQDIDVRLGQSDFFLGGTYTYMQTNNSLPQMNAVVGDSFAHSIRDQDLALKLTYDSRNNHLAPTQGTKAGVKVNFHDVDFGMGQPSSKDHYTKYHTYLHRYDRLSERWGLALRGDVKRVEGDYTFYARPYVDMRGIAAMSIQGSNTALTEVEIGYDLDDRWTLIGFTGVGTAYEDNEGLSRAKWHSTGGAGFRYLIARQLGLTTGVDVAVGPQEETVHVQFGGSW
ncbi:BamA/TamA family outer membrane protein [Vibrio tubiashii]|nr:BamA/TamA family outer membrane protein [Vibrio tubiashii]